MAYTIKQQIGFSAEKIARAFLQKQGCVFLMKNYRCRFGEIDLIMKDKDDIVFVEVRKRNCIIFGNAHESINQQKQRRLLKTAIHFLQKKAWYDQVKTRFDVIALHPVAGKMELEWIKNAF